MKWFVIIVLFGSSNVASTSSNFVVGGDMQVVEASSEQSCRDAVVFLENAFRAHLTLGWADCFTM
jgi:hypothetical protein